MSDPLASPSPAATPEPVKRRRAHRKTKTGCIDCRRRRVKCDEKKPSCRACVRRGVSCTYTAEGQAVTDASLELPPTPYTAASRQSSPALPYGPPHAQFTEPSSTATPAPSQNHSVAYSDHAPPCPSQHGTTTTPCPHTFSINDLALHHHWTLSTSLTISRVPSYTDTWQRVLPEVGFHHPFVTHAILSVAALHLAHSSRGTRESDAYVAKAVECHNAGLQGFRESVAEITEANSEALFVWSLLNMIYVFGIFRCQRGAGDSHVPRPKDLVLGIEWIPMTRGIEAVLQPTHNHLRFGRMRHLMSVGNWDELEPGPPDGSSSSRGGDRVDVCLCRARETWWAADSQNGSSNGNDAETYDEALRILRKCRMFIEQFETMDAAALAEWGDNRARAGPLMFVHFVPHAYFTLLHQRQPPALVLFAYFGAFLHGIDDFWFMEGLGREIVEVVGDLLGSYWRPWISWPLECVGLD